MSSVNLNFHISPQKRQPSRENRRGDKIIFGNAEKMGKEVIHLSRLTRLHNVLPQKPANREQDLCKIKTVWSEVYDHLLNKENCSSNESEIIGNGLSKLIAKYIKIYKTDLEKVGDQTTKIRRFIKDVEPLRLSVSPVTKSTSGNNGPTFLINYDSPKGFRAYVAKWASIGEQTANHIYQEFSHCFSSENYSCGFSVPYSCNLDFRNHIYESGKGNIQEISQELSIAIKDNFLEFTKAYHSKLNPKSTNISFLEKIPGKNLLEFCYKQYKILTAEQRDKFFERLGRLSMMDLLFAQHDRIVYVHRLGKETYVTSEIKKNGEQYGVSLVVKPQEYIMEDSGESNLGNVMIVFKGEAKDFDFYAIDNGIDYELVTNPDCREMYVYFLRNLFSNPNHIDELVKNICISFKNALARQIDEIDDKKLELENKDENKKALEIIHERLEPLQQDLECIAPEALAKGLRKMANWLQNEILDKAWNTSPEANRLKQYLERVSPGHLQVVHECLNTLKVRK